MRICLVTNLYGENARGGAERVVETEARALASSGHEVAVVALTDDLPGTSTEDGIVIIRVHAPNLYFYPKGHGRSIAIRFLWHCVDILNVIAARRVAQAVNGFSPDVVHTHNLMGLGFLVPRALRKSGIPHVHTVHDVQLIHPSGALLHDHATVSGPRRMVRSVYAMLMRTLFGSPDTVIFPSRFLAKMHEERGFFPDSRVAIVPNPVDPAVMNASSSTDRPTVLFAGQLEQHKGIDLLLDAWSEVGGNARLEIAGTGTYEDDVRHRSGSKQDIVLLGYLDKEGMQDAYARATFVIVPSRVIENQPTVILEAHARGIPVIAAMIGGIPEIVTEGETGFLFAPDDTDALVAVLRRALGMVKSVEGMRVKIRDAARCYTPDTHVSSLEETYAEVGK